MHEETLIQSGSLGLYLVVRLDPQQVLAFKREGVQFTNPQMVNIALYVLGTFEPGSVVLSAHRQDITSRRIADQRREDARISQDKKQILEKEAKKPRLAVTVVSSSEGVIRLPSWDPVCYPMVAT